MNTFVPPAVINILKASQLGKRSRESAEDARETHQESRISEDDENTSPSKRQRTNLNQGGQDSNNSGIVLKPIAENQAEEPDSINENDFFMREQEEEVPEEKEDQKMVQEEEIKEQVQQISPVNLASSVNNPEGMTNQDLVIFLKDPKQLL